MNCNVSRLNIICSDRRFCWDGYTLHNESFYSEKSQSSFLKKINISGLKWCFFFMNVQNTLIPGVQ